MEEIKMPQLGQSVEEASIVEWFKQEGDRVEKGEPLFSIQTDKAEIEYESPVAGVLRKILLPPDELAPVLTVVGLVGDEDEALPDLSQYTSEQSAPAAPPEQEPGETAAPAKTKSPASSAALASSGRQAGVSPRARNTAQRLGVDPTATAGSGPGGRVIEEDVIAAASDQPKVTPTARRLAELEGVDLATVQGSGAGGKITKADVERAASAPAAQPEGGAGVRRIALTPMRRIIADRMSQSKHEAPHYYMTVEVDMAASRQFREGVGSFKPSYNDFVLRACVRAIQDFPLVNARWAGDAIEQVADVNIGFAVALPDGLVVPVVKQAQTKSLRQLHEESRQLAEKARNGRLTPDDYSGNTFTVSNLGAFGVDHFTAIINQPDSAILAVGQIKEQPVVIDGGIQVRPIMKMTLSSDHRVIDGAVAAQFLGRVKKILEEADY